MRIINNELEFSMSEHLEYTHTIHTYAYTIFFSGFVTNLGCFKYRIGFAVYTFTPEILNAKYKVN